MESSFVWALVATLLGSGIPIVLAALLGFASSRTLEWLIPRLVSFAIGSLLGAAFVGLIPQALEGMPIDRGLSVVLLGILLFFLMEKMIIWRHCHKQTCVVHDVTPGLLLIGDAVHNFLDGFALSAAFITSVPLGITTAFGVFAHELPQEIGDYAILLNGGLSKRRALFLNALSGATAIPGVVIGFYFASCLTGTAPYIMALAAASFIYIAIADLIPGLQKRLGLRESVTQLVLMLAGLGTVYLFHGIVH